MVKYFSVDWLAQSHHTGAQSAERATGADAAPTCKPHILCMEQPRPPTFGKGYLQPKSATPKCTIMTRHAEPVESNGYSSGYESEAASSECPSVDEGSEGERERDGPQRRTRTKFTPEQIGKLEKIFNKHRYLEAGERVKMAQKLKLTETQVRTWFQNRRMKLKRELQDYLTPQVPALMFHALPPVRYHGVGGQPPRFPVTEPGFYPLSAPRTAFQQQMPAHHPPHMIYSQSFY